MVPWWGAIAECHCGVPWWGAIVGCQCWVLLLGAIAGCQCWVLAGWYGGVPFVGVVVPW